jgi:hypothetical protein
MDPQAIDTMKAQEVAMAPIARCLANQYQRVWDCMRDAIRKCPDADGHRHMPPHGYPSGRQAPVS